MSGGDRQDFLGHGQRRERGVEFVDRVDVGIAHVNQPTLGGEVHLPFGGVKASGIGPHEQGREAIDFFTKVKSVYINYA